MLASLTINIPLYRDDITPVKPVQFTTGVTFDCAIYLPATASFKKALSAQGQQREITHKRQQQIRQFRYLMSTQHVQFMWKSMLLPQDF